MQQLTGLDTSFLNMETPTTYGHVSGLALFDPTTAPGPVGLEDLKRIISEGDAKREDLPEVSKYRRRSTPQRIEFRDMARRIAETRM